MAPARHTHCRHLALNYLSGPLPPQLLCNHPSLVHLKVSDSVCQQQRLVGSTGS